jgi:hypothetical protein
MEYEEDGKPELVTSKATRIPPRSGCFVRYPDETSSHSLCLIGTSARRDGLPGVGKNVGHPGSTGYHERLSVSGTNLADLFIRRLRRRRFRAKHSEEG